MIFAFAHLSTACADIDHTIPYPQGPTHPCNLKCLCRKHLWKTFGIDWRDMQFLNGTVIRLGHPLRSSAVPDRRWPGSCRQTAPEAGLPAAWVWL